MVDAIADVIGTLSSLATVEHRNEPFVTADTDVLGRTPGFNGTRVPVRVLFEHLQAGDPLDVFLKDFPSVSRNLAIIVLKDACTSLIADAHPAR